MDISIALFVLVLIGFPALILSLTMRRAEDMEAIVVRERLTGRIVGLIIGPRWFLAVPGLDLLQSLDLHFQLDRFDEPNIQTAEGLSANMSITVGWQVTPACLAQANLREVLPYLPEIGTLVTMWIQYVVRNATSQFDLENLQYQVNHVPGFRQLLAHELQAHVAPLGVEIRNLELYCVPAPAVVAARMEAEAQAQERMRLAAARETEIMTLLRAVGGNATPEQIVQLLAIEALRQGEGRVITSLGLGNQQQGGAGSASKGSTSASQGGGAPQGGAPNPHNPHIQVVVTP